MDPYKKHRELLLLEEYRILSEKADRLTGLIWYLSTGVFAIVGLGLINIITKPLVGSNSLRISIPAALMIILYIIVSKRWHNIIILLYARMRSIEEALGFDGNKLIERKDESEKPIPIKKVRLTFSFILICCLFTIPFIKTNEAKKYSDKILILSGITQTHKSIENPTHVMKIKSAKNFEIYFPKGSLLVENNYLSNKKTIIELTNYLKNIPVTSEYKAMIVGYCCIERINSNNHRVNNNCELSKARAENIKFFINELMLKNNNQLKKIEYFCGSFSNQKSLSHDINEQRKVEITFYEVSNVQAP